MIALLFTVAILGAIFYWAFVKGNIWPILLFIFGVAGGKALILEYFPESSHTILTFMNCNVSYAAFIATVIAFLGIGYMMGKNE